MMRRAFICTALLGFAVLGVPAAASAAGPEVTLKAKIVPIQKNLSKKGGATWPGTGNILGAGAAVEFKFTIKGTEYPDGHPDPLRHVNTYFPKGTKVTTKGFPTCPASDFENLDPKKCPKGSLASAPGEANGVVDFGNSPVPEKVTVQAYFAANSGLTFWIEGRKPAIIEKTATGKVTKVNDGEYGVLGNVEVPLVETVPGGFDASTESIDVIIGAAYQKGGKLVSYGTVPTKCPKGGFPGKAELSFGEGSESSWTTVTKTTTIPCPKAAKGKK